MNLNNTNYRYERKFIIRDPLINTFDLINPQYLLINEIYNERIVNSIYYDTDNFYLAKETQGGLSFRYKVRLRYYGDETNINNPKLEIKLRIANKGKKYIFDINKKELFESSFRLPSLININQLPNEINRNIFLSLKPKIHINYRRKYYKFDNSDLRITFDKDIKFQEFCNFSSKNINQIRYPSKVLELKYNDYSKNYIRLLMKGIPYRLTSCSKYIMGLKDLGLLKMI